MKKFESTRILLGDSTSYDPNLVGFNTYTGLSKIWPSQDIDTFRLGYIISTAYSFMVHDLDLGTYYHAVVAPNPLTDTISIQVIPNNERFGVTEDMCSTLANLQLLESFIEYMRATDIVYLSDGGFSDKVIQVPIKILEYSEEEFSYMFYCHLKVWQPVIKHPYGVNKDEWWNGESNTTPKNPNEIRKLLLVPYFMHDYAVHDEVLDRLWGRALLMR